MFIHTAIFVVPALAMWIVTTTLCAVAKDADPLYVLLAAVAGILCAIVFVRVVMRPT
jgi:hypothetical protein